MEVFIKLYGLSYLIGLGIFWYWDRKGEHDRPKFFNFFSEGWFMHYLIGIPLIGWFAILIIGIIIGILGGDIYIGRY